MKLIKIYSNNNKMKPVVFNDGFSVVYGDVDKVNSNNDKSHEHNLGKTALVYLIDFLLLKKSDKDDIFVKYKEKFSGWDFYLEIELNNENYLTIKRGVDSCTKASFKLHKEKNQDFSDEQFWDYKERSLASKKEDNAVKILKEYLDFDVTANYNFRKFLSYLLRTQDDYRDVFKLEKFEGGDLQWKPYLFELLGFNGELLEKKYELDAEIKKGKDAIKRMEAENVIESDKELYTLKAAIEAKEREKKEIQDAVDRFNFYIQEQNLNSELVSEIESKISKLNSEEYRLSYEIDKIKKSLKNHITFDLDEIKQVFDDVKIYFPDTLAKSYEDLVKFNEQISKERSKYLKGEFVEIQERLAEIKKELEKLNLKRSDILSILKEEDSFVKFKKHQQEVIKIEGEIAGFKQRIENIGSIEKYNEKIAEIVTRVKDLKIDVKDNINEGNEIFQEIKRVFGELFKETMNGTALLVVSPNRAGNIEFDSPALSADGTAFTGQGDGHTATKVQCAAFVLSVLAYYSKNSFFRFAYHDGVFESWGDNPTMNFIKLAKEYCDKYNMQYIVSMIRSDVPAGYVFEENEKILILNEQNKLFGFDF